MRASSGLADRVAAAGLDRPVGEIVALQAGLADHRARGAPARHRGARPARHRRRCSPLPPPATSAPEVALRRRAKQRKQAIEAELPDVLDLLRVAIAAGLAPRRALAEVGRRHPGVARRRTQTRRGARAASASRPKPRSTSSRRAARPTASRSSPPHCAGPSATAPHSAPPCDAQAAEARSLRAAHRSELAARAAPKIQLVVALLLVPAVLLLVAAALIPALLGG